MKKVAGIFVILVLLGCLGFVTYKPSVVFNNLYKIVTIQPYDAPVLGIEISDSVQQELDTLRNVLLKQFVLYPKPAYSDVTVLNDAYSGKAKLRFKGDQIGHLANENWSFKLKLPKGKKWEGRNVNKFHHPKERRYINEYVFLKILKDEGLLSLDYDFAKVRLNGKEYLYAFEENFSKVYLKNHKLKGAIVKFNEVGFWETHKKGFVKKEGEHMSPYKSADVIVKSNVKGFDKQALIKTLERYKTEGMLPPGLFDLEKCAKFIALSHIFGAGHGLIWHNLKLYYNNNTQKIEIIGTDGMAGYSSVPVEERLNNLVVALRTSDEFNQLYNKYLKKYATDKFLYGFMLRNYQSIKSRVILLEQYYPKSDTRTAFIMASMENLQRQMLIKKRQH